MEITSFRNVLFVCSRNRWRSPTAEKIWSRVPAVSVRSVGTSRSARRRLTIADIQWAELICVMEQKHKSRIQKEFREEIAGTPIHILDIPDDYSYMDPELVEILLEKTQPLMGKPCERDVL
ncbi:MAG: phosphotyrosine protein phosphatase [Hyphomicrobiaceae bacterium]|nr:phosphotyrosine protein phosphatase [Hyphomicrobiaceae bacterium]